MINRLLLLSGNDIPFVEASLTIHQPTVKQIAYIGQQNFFMGCQYLTFSKNNLSEQDKNHLTNYDDFEILMTMIQGTDAAVQKSKICIELVLSLLFPQYQINFLPVGIMFFKKNKETDEIERYFINKENYSIFKILLKQIFCLGQFSNTSEKYNPGGPQAKSLVQKFKQRQEKLAKLKSQGKKQQISIFSQYISILAVGMHKDMNQLLQYTVYQLFDEFHRFKMKESYDLYVQAKMAGARDLEEIENWMSDIHLDTV